MFLEVRNLCFSYYRQPLCLKDINFSLEKNKRVLVLGSEGMAKTTLLLVLSGMEDSYFGEIKLNGKNAKQISDSDKKISYLPSEPVFFKNKTILQNFEYLFNVENITLPREELEKLLHDFNIDKSLDVKVKKLSLFEQKKLAFARTLLKNPDLILIDDQFDLLDEKEAKEMEIILQKLFLNNSTIIMTMGNENYKKRKNVLKLLKFDEYFYIYDAKMQKYKSLDDFEKGMQNINCLKFLDETYFNFGTYLEFQDNFFNIYFENTFISLEGNIFESLRKKLNLKTGEQEDIIITSTEDLDFEKISASDFQEKISGNQIFIFSRIDGERLI